jgi:arylsulfatase A-like enzyme
MPLVLLLCLGLLLTACGGGGGGTTNAPLATDPPPSAPPAPVEADPPPNILLIMADDLGYNDLAINNENPDIHTPNMDQLAGEGIRFTRHYATAVCSPARAALLTGQFPERNGYLPSGRGLSPQLITLPEALQQEGYTTWHLGKWHLGDQHREGWPDQQGFDHWLGFLNQWYLAGAMEDGALKISKPRYNDPWLQGDTEPGRHFAGHLENILADKAIEVLDGLENEGSPWFLNLWFYAPHNPNTPAQEFADLYPDSDEGRYRALVHQLDHNIGRVLDHLRNSEQWSNTIVVLVSDNGGTNAYFDNNYPFYGRKATMLEGGLRTPMIVRFPDEESPGAVYPQIVSVQDIYPTLMEALSLPPPTVFDGTSFYSALANNQATREGDLFWDRSLPLGFDYGVLSEDGHWRLNQRRTLFSTEPEVQLFDLESDPTGAQYLEPPPPQKLAELEGKYFAWHRDVHAVTLAYDESGAGAGTLTGMDFLRTPGFGGYTFGLGISQDSFGTLVEQADVWKLSRSGDIVTAEFGDMLLSADIDTQATCHAVIVSAYFQHHLSTISGPAYTDIQLYVDGQLSDFQRVDQAFLVEDLSLPTRVGSPAGGGSFHAPTVLNIPIHRSPAWTVDSFSSQLCEGA